MGLEITRKKDGTLRSKYWYGRFEVNGQSKTVSLNVEVKGCVPATLREIGDSLFERSRAQAQVKLNELIREARSNKAAEKHLQDLYELKAGDALHNAPLTELETIWDNIPVKKTRSEAWVKNQHSSLDKFRKFVTKQHPHATTMPQVTRAMALAWMRELDKQGARAETYNHKLNLLQSVFNPGENTGVLRNPFEGIPRKRKMTVHREPFTEEELASIIQHCDDLFRPVWFSRRIIMPLLPKEATLSLENEGAIEWGSLSTMIRTRDKNRSTLPNNASALSAPDGDSGKPSALPLSC